MMSGCRLNRTAFKAQTAQEASNHAAYYKTLTWQERLKITDYLNNIADNYPENNHPKMDRAVFSYRSRNK